MNNNVKIKNTKGLHTWHINNERKLYEDKNLLIVFCITLASVVSITSISPDFPMLEKVFDVSDTKIGLLITAFTVPGMILAPVIGVLADKWGRKKYLFCL